MASALGKAPPETERKERRGCLQELKLRIGDMENALYCEAELNRLHVHIEPFTLNEEGEPAFKPCFFKPFMSQLKDDPRAPLTLMTMTGYHITTIQVRNCQKTGRDLHFTIGVNIRSTKFWTSRKGLVLRANNFGLNLEGSQGPVDWIVWAAGHLPDFPKRPHFLCMMATDIDSENDKITRGELLCILKMQEKFHEVSFLKKHIIYPILLLSFMGPRHARMLQAYYNGSKLVIQKTELYDFTRDRNLKVMSLFTRWSSSSGIGNTRP